MEINSSDRAQEIIRAWLNRVLEAKSWAPSRLAKEAKVSPATISRALNDDQFTTSTTTIEKIVKATGIAAPSGIGSVSNATEAGFAEPEAEYIAEPETLDQILKIDGAQAVWRLQTRSIELAGYVPGVYLIVDPSVEPRAGDAVCVQIYNFRSTSAETAWRIFDPPYVVTKTMDRNAERKPLLIDNERVAIWGTVIKSVRIRDD